MNTVELVLIYVYYITYLQSRKTWSWFPEIPTAILCHLLSANSKGIFSTTFTAMLDEDEAVKEDDEVGKNEDEVCKDDEENIISSKLRKSGWRLLLLLDNGVDDTGEICSWGNSLAR